MFEATDVRDEGLRGQPDARIFTFAQRGRAATAAAQAGHRLRSVLAARPRIPHRQDPLARRSRRRRLAQDHPRFTGENFQRNLRIVHEVEAVAAEAGATPAQVALAWLLAQGSDIAPIPSTKRVARVEENTGADRVELSAKQIERVTNLTPAAGERHEKGNMAVIDR
jgi:aryl-alcohol dehydrogenase-like predicted oxidoreductase